MIYVTDRLKALLSRPRRDQLPQLLNTICLVTIFQWFSSEVEVVRHCRPPPVDIPYSRGKPTYAID
jgi:hypothetical protein